MPVVVKCIQCGTERNVRPSRAKTYKFCDYHCRGAWRKENWTGCDHPRWSGGERKKTCQNCGCTFSAGNVVTHFRKQKFCSKKCADEGGFRFRGPSHYKWHGNPRRGQRPSSQRSWARKVTSRDNATCQRCGATGVELHAHHIKPHKEFPELRWEVSNGITLCYQCHWAEHSANDANGVNSGKPAAGNAGGNPEPSLSGNVQEGVTTRGRAYRRWIGTCGECGKFLSRQLSDVTGKSAVFCDRVCRGKWTSRVRKGVPNGQRYGSNASTSALPETDDIV